LQSPLLTIITVSGYETSRLVTTLSSLQFLDNRVEHICVIPYDDIAGRKLWEDYKKAPNSILVGDSGSGIYEAMNSGARLASGRNLLFLNAGDELLSETSTNDLIKVLVNENSDLYIFKASAPWAPLQAENLKEFKRFTLGYSGIFISHQATIISKRFFDNLGGFFEGYRTSADTRLLVQASYKTTPLIYPLAITLVEFPKFASKFQRSGRLENLRTIFAVHKGSGFLISSFNFISRELISLIQIPFRIFQSKISKLDRIE